MASESGFDRPAGGAVPPGLVRAGQVALVTGGSAGLGLAIAAALARAGSGVVIASRSAGRCEQAAASLSAQAGIAVQGRSCDVTDERAVARLADQVMTDHGRLDVLVTSAGVQARGTLDQLDVTTLRACLEVNVVGTWLACRAAAAPMRAAGYGRILTSAFGGQDFWNGDVRPWTYSAFGPVRYRMDCCFQARTVIAGLVEGPGHGGSP